MTLNKEMSRWHWPTLIPLAGAFFSSSYFYSLFPLIFGIVYFCVVGILWLFAIRRSYFVFEIPQAVRNEKRRGEKKNHHTMAGLIFCVTFFFTHLFIFVVCVCVYGMFYDIFTMKTM